MQYKPSFAVKAFSFVHKVTAVLGILLAVSLLLPDALQWSGLLPEINSKFFGSETNIENYTTNVAFIMLGCLIIMTLSLLASWNID